MTAPELTAAEAARAAVFDNAPDPDESLRMRVANAIIVAAFRKDIANGYVSPTQCVDAADAALAVVRGEVQ